MSSKILELVKTLASYNYKIKGFDLFMKNVQFISADKGQCKAEFTVASEHLNAAGTLHGGCISTLVDCVSSYALMVSGPKASEGQISPGGVSVDLHVTFLKAALPGEVIVIDAKTIKTGRTLAFLEVELSKKKDGVVVARGQHTKFIAAH